MNLNDSHNIATKAVISGLSRPKFLTCPFSEFVETTLKCCKYNFTPIENLKVCTSYEGDNSEVCSFEIISPGEFVVQESSSYPMTSRGTLYNCIDYKIELKEPATILKSRCYKSVEIEREVFVFGVRTKCYNCLLGLIFRNCKGELIH
jgi:hypothetical protein